MRKHVLMRHKKEIQQDGISFWGFSKGTKFMGQEAFTSEELNDLVRIVIYAHRKGKGDLILLSGRSVMVHNCVASLMV